MKSKTILLTLTLLLLLSAFACVSGSSSVPTSAPTNELSTDNCQLSTAPAPTPTPNPFLAWLTQPYDSGNPERELANFCFDAGHPFADVAYDKAKMSFKEPYAELVAKYDLTAFYQLVQAAGQKSIHTRSYSTGLFVSIGVQYHQSNVLSELFLMRDDEGHEKVYAHYTRATGKEGILTVTAYFPQADGALGGRVEFSRAYRYGGDKQIGLEAVLGADPTYTARLIFVNRLDKLTYEISMADWQSVAALQAEAYAQNLTIEEVLERYTASILSNMLSPNEMREVTDIFPGDS